MLPYCNIDAPNIIDDINLLQQSFVKFIRRETRGVPRSRSVKLSPFKGDGGFLKDGNGVSNLEVYR